MSVVRVRVEGIRVGAVGVKAERVGVGVVGGRKGVRDGGWGGSGCK